MSATNYNQPKKLEDYKQQVKDIWEKIGESVEKSGDALKNVDNVVNAFLPQKNAATSKLREQLTRLGNFANKEEGIQKSDLDLVRNNLTQLNTRLKEVGRNSNFIAKSVNADKGKFWDEIMAEVDPTTKPSVTQTIQRSAATQRLDDETKSTQKVNQKPATSVQSAPTANSASPAMKPEPHKVKAPATAANSTPSQVVSTAQTSFIDPPRVDEKRSASGPLTKEEKAKRHADEEAIKRKKQEKDDKEAFVKDLKENGTLPEGLKPETTVATLARAALASTPGFTDQSVLGKNEEAKRAADTIAATQTPAAKTPAPAAAEAAKAAAEAAKTPAPAAAEDAKAAAEAAKTPAPAAAEDAKAAAEAAKTQTPAPAAAEAAKAAAEATQTQTPAPAAEAKAPAAPEAEAANDPNSNLAPKMGGTPTAPANIGAEVGTSAGSDIPDHQNLVSAQSAPRDEASGHSSQTLTYLERLQAEVKKHPDAQVEDLKNLPQNKKNNVDEMQKLAIGASQERGPLHDAPGFIKQDDGTYKLNNPSQLEGPIFMSRLDQSGKQVKDHEGKPVYDVLVFDPKGRLNHEKSFIAPDDCPLGSKSTVDPDIKQGYLKTHHDLHTKQQGVSIVKTAQIEASTSTVPNPTFRHQTPGHDTTVWR